MLKFQYIVISGILGSSLSALAAVLLAAVSDPKLYVFLTGDGTSTLIFAASLGAISGMCIALLVKK